MFWAPISGKQGGDAVDFVDAFGPEGDAVFVGEVSGGFGDAEEFGAACAGGGELEPVGPADVFGEAEGGQQAAVEGLDGGEIRDAEVDVVEAAHGGTRRS